MQNYRDQSRIVSGGAVNELDGSPATVVDSLAQYAFPRAKTSYFQPPRLRFRVNDLYLISQVLSFCPPPGGNTGELYAAFACHFRSRHPGLYSAIRRLSITCLLEPRRASRVLEGNHKLLRTYRLWMPKLVEASRWLGQVDDPTGGLFRRIRAMAERRRKFVERQWNSNLEATTRVMSIMTGFDFSRINYRVMISPPGIADGKNISGLLGRKVICWHGCEAWKYYSTVYCWHEILHDPSLMGCGEPVEHALVEIATDIALRGFLRPLSRRAQSHLHLAECRQAILENGHWEKFLQENAARLQRGHSMVNMREFAEDLKLRPDIAECAARYRTEKAERSARRR